MHAVAKSQAVAKTGEGPVKLLWIDGVLSEDQLYNLHAYLFITNVQQSDTYCVITFTGRADGMKLREFIDPNIFVLQTNDKCTALEINFNPTAKQVESLRRLYAAMSLRRIN